MELNFYILKSDVSRCRTLLRARECIINSALSNVIFMRNVPQTFAPHFVRRSKLSAERCAGKPSFREEPFAPRTSRNIGKNSMLSQTNLQKKEIRSLARSFFSRSVMRY
jgi:hypothetical protein